MRFPLNARGLAGVADQALSSATNVALTIVVAREVAPAELGAFGVAYAVYLVAVGLSRALSCEPLLLRFGHVSAERWKAGTRDSTGTAVMTGVAGGAVLAAAAYAVGGSTGEALLPLALFLPGLLLKDAWRFAFIAAGRPGRAIRNDAVWALGQVLAVGWVLVAATPTAGTFVAAWGSAALPAAAFGIVQARCAPAPLRARRWIAEHRDLLPGYTVDFAARMGGRQLAFLSVGMFGGLAAVAAIRAAEVLFGALNMVLQAVPLVALPQAVSVRRGSATALGTLAAALSAGLVVLALAYALAAMLVPDSLGRAIAGDSWPLAEPVLAAQCALVTSIAAVTGPAIGLRALGDARRGASVRLLVAPLSVTAGAMGAWLGGASGALYGLALANCAGFVAWVWQFRRALTDVRSTPETPSATAVSQPA